MNAEGRVGLTSPGARERGKDIGPDESDGSQRERPRLATARTSIATPTVDATARKSARAPVLPRYRGPLRRLGWLLFALAAVEVLATIVPNTIQFRDIPHYLPVHTLLETVSIIVSAMVFAVGWNSRARNLSENILVLACAFLGVGILDFCHMASYVGMPDFISANDAQKHLYFWLAARLLAAGALLGAALRPWSVLATVGKRYIYLGATLILTAAVVWLVSFDYSRMPDVFLAGHGLTAFKKSVEYAVIAVNALTATVLLLRMRQPQSFNIVLLFGAVCMLAMSEIFFTLYSTMTGTYNVAGHVYKVLAYLMIYRAIVVEVIETPYALLEKAKVKFSNIFDSVTDGIELISEDGVIIDMNRAGYERLGYQRQDVVNHPLDEFSANSRSLVRTESIFRLSRDNKITFESTRRRRDGSIMPVEVNARTIEIDDRTLILGISRDITERKAAEQALLTESEKNRVFLRNASDGIHILDADGTLIEASDSFCAMLGLTRDEAIGRHISTWDARFTVEELQDKLVTLFATFERSQFETRHRRADGSVFEVEVSSVLLKLKSRYVLFNSSRDITHRKEADLRIEQLAFYDPLTLLPNRRLLVDRLQQAMASCARTGKNGAVLLIDLDNFKTINDTLGHEVGDLLLKQVAGRFTNCLRKGDSIARFGGDEFVVLLADLGPGSNESVVQTELVANKLLHALDAEALIGMHALRNTASIGATLFDRKQSPDELIKQADIAMYQAKAAGRNTLRLFDPAMQEAVRLRAALESSLRMAVDGDEFVLHYQMQVDGEMRPFGAEALIRWQRPGHGLIPPGTFIPLAEETHLILPIGLWVLETACRQLKAWEGNPLTRSLTLSINVSARQFQDAGFVTQVRDAVGRHGIDPRRLVLEPTESLFLDQISESITTLRALRSIGVGCSLDDFGTGFSSLQYLKRLPLDQLKIDQSFVRDLAGDSNDQAIVRTIVAMAKSLGLTVLAEGVETEEQLRLLQHYGCEYFQGYLFGRPVPVEAFQAALQALDGEPAFPPTSCPAPGSPDCMGHARGE
ncbi:MAG: EAL domain-containing protein [Burkholderiales bacterium]|nr:EAL domain-containing protein [Burkholderiales bacterium]